MILTLKIDKYYKRNMHKYSHKYIYIEIILFYFEKYSNKNVKIVIPTDIK